MLELEIGRIVERLIIASCIPMLLVIGYKLLLLGVAGVCGGLENCSRWAFQSSAGTSRIKGLVSKMTLEHFSISIALQTIAQIGTLQRTHT